MSTRIRDRGGIAFACIWISGVNAGVAVALSPALPAMAKEFGHGADGAFIAQMIQTLPAVAMILGAAFCGYASETIGRRVVMLVTAVLFLVSGVAGLFLPTLELIILSRVIQGAVAGALVTASYAAVAEYFQGAARARMLGYCAGFGSFSSILFLLAAGAMVDAFGWRSVFALFLTQLITLPFLVFSLPQERPARETGAALSWGPILAVWPVWLLQIVFTIGMYMSVIQVPFVASAKGVISASTIGLLVSTTSVVATLASLFHGNFRRYLDYGGMLVLIAAAFGLGLLICANASDMAALFLGAAVLGVGAGSVEPTIMARALNRTPEPLRDRAAGAGLAALFAGQFLNPVAAFPLIAIGGVAFAISSFGFMYLALSAVFLCAALLRRGRSSTPAQE